MNLLTRDRKNNFWRDGRGKPGRCETSGETLTGHPCFDRQPRLTADMG
ncbi:hypothetical protein PhaeoP23_02131 [Phaeobacter piscinae]|uniref:Uncharacterized protein n=1 Tax=Phaeobacter piscinae TaxID=1580596 RepID=A0ABN5DFT2_9RHOB|nr:hypothetical protein PhaeoP36_02131 [Phaeobacter piscinae]ATG40199.1 hypothetical protein PhaeoP14_02117 [Phaeobacter piscinae]AUQ86780.1 hypothetical protein PhaeoP42_02132 [Phaeobacter piscinae]AUR24663.1 hypothetical protein PhaeoP23_02131 [Phaeobacter piscinae]UTS81170.1 hypothetical protein OL67_002248 [Phaeobacter piscinae]